MSRNPEDKYDVIHAATEAAGVQRKSIRVLPDVLTPGSREVALLTAVTKAQADSIIPMAKALESLRDKGPEIWGSAFLVAADGDFSWRTAPLRRYDSFEDFYDSELAPVYGSYEEFVRVTARVVRGELSATEAVEQLTPTQEVEKRKAGKRKPFPGSANQRNNITTVTGTRRDYTLDRLQRDAPELFDAVERNELSPHAAAVQAGFRPKTFTVRADKPESIVGTLRRQLDPEVLAMVTKLLSEEI